METFDHIKTVVGIVLGLSITHLLKGTVKIVDNPAKYKPYWVHLVWGFYIFLLLIHFWWWEVYLHTIKTWAFSQYFFVVCYVTIYYALCCILFPDDLSGHTSYESYFYQRKKWFFGLLAVAFAADIIDTLMKGRDYYETLGWEYPVRNISHIVLCLAAIKIKQKKFHAWLAIVFVVYELSWIWRQYYV